MRIGIVSDTHDDLAAVEAAVALFDREGVDAVVHCGDFVAPFSVTPFDVAGVDFYAVRGNNDGEWAVQSTVESFGTYLGRPERSRSGAKAPGAGTGAPGAERTPEARTGRTPSTSPSPTGRAASSSTRSSTAATTTTCSTVTRTLTASRSAARRFG